MAGIFPRNGLAAGVDNSGLALTNTPAVGCDALYYNELCAQKVDPRAFNKLMSELVAVINACTGMTYDCTEVDNVLRALRCIFPGLHNIQTFATPGSYVFTVPAGVQTIFVQVVGGGAGGAGTTTLTPGFSGAGGGAGGYTNSWFHSTPNTNHAVVVGAGGTPGPLNNSATVQAYGGDGGNSSFTFSGAVQLLATGGKGGECGYGGAGGGAPGQGTGGQINLYGGYGGDGHNFNKEVQGGHGGASFFGGGGRSFNTMVATNPGVGLAPGSGGGGGWFKPDVTGASGAPGIVIVQW